MAEITQKAYQDLRDYIQATWKYIEIRDDKDTPIMRLEVGVDPRVNWSHSANAQTLEITAVISGDDVDVTLPKTFAKTAIYKVATGGDAYSVEAFSAFTMESLADELTIKHQIEVPQVV